MQARDIRWGYPRPQLRRRAWTCLNGTWQFALDPDARWRRPDEVSFNRSIEVPFAPETRASGIADPGFHPVCWYRREFARPALGPGDRCLLRFEAVDYEATVWVNGHFVGEHTGGYTPFAFDITSWLREGDSQEVVVRAADDPADLTKPRGKQDWQLTPHSIWYERTTGIWQTVWMEVVPSTCLADLRWLPVLERWEIGVAARVTGPARDAVRLRVRLTGGGHTLADDTFSVFSGEVHRGIALSDPGIDDYRNELLWSPASPTLIRADLELLDQRGAVLDAARSYTALRSLGVQGDRILLNGRPFPLRLVLDQGYWPESGLTGPGDAALRRDVVLAKQMGFNGVRKHQKVEAARYLYWADRLGLLVWSEMPSAYRFTPESVGRVTREWLDVMTRDFSHPCIMAWVPFNESWGVPNLPESSAQQHYVRGLYHLTRTLDPSRLVVGNDGWEAVATDVVGVHDYDPDAQRLGSRYGGEVGAQFYRRERPAGRLLVLGQGPTPEAPIVLSEFGGVAIRSNAGDTWGYATAGNDNAFADHVTRLLVAARTAPMLSGFCYTQFADTYQEANGLLYADRTPKFPLDDIARAVSGSAPRALPGEAEAHEYDTVEPAGEER
jgi:beta-galactosidase/beta-glucuronidase